MGFIESERTINLIDYFRILTRHKWVLIFSLVVAVGVCVWYNSKLIPIYGTSTVLIIDRESTRSPITGQTMEYESYLSESMTFNTHFEMITSQAVLERVVRNLNLDKLDKDKTLYVLCGSGNRATTAAAYLKVKGYDVIVITGGAEMYRNIV